MQDLCDFKFDPISLLLPTVSGSAALSDAYLLLEKAVEDGFRLRNPVELGDFYDLPGS
jgi:hypothetical protein